MSARILARLGDVNPIEYGGGVIFSRDSAAEPSIEYTHGLEDPENKRRGLMVYRVDIPDDVFQYHNWAKVKSIASTIGMDPDELLRLGKSRAIPDRALAIEVIASNHGWHELDQYPERYSATEIEERWSL